MSRSSRKGVTGNSVLLHPKIQADVERARAAWASMTDRKDGANSSEAAPIPGPPTTLNLCCIEENPQ
jgi:hypothetical protein